MRLGFICEPSNNAYYRAIIPMRALERRGHTVVWGAKFGDDVPMLDLLSCDLVHCYRRLDRVEDLHKLFQRGVAISFDNDDNYAAAEVSDRGSGLAGNRYNREIFRGVVQAARMSDLTTTPSTTLADIYRAAGVGNVAVIENRLERRMLGFGSRAKHDATVVGWIAGREHGVDLKRIPIAEAFDRLLDIHRTLRVLTVGVRLPLRSERYEHVAEVPFPQLLAITSKMDVGVAPLADSAFNRSRSSVKLKEYSSGGALWLASPVGPYRSFGEREGGRLVGDGEWFTALDELIRSSRCRRRMARRALKWAKRETIDNHTEPWEKAFLAAVDRARERAGAARIG
jgi:hypothetical protein